MSRSVSRRHWLRTAAFGAVPATLAAQPVDRTKPPPEAVGLSAYHEGGKIVVRRNNRPLTTYRANTDQRFPYFFPVAGPVTGASLTVESAMPYPHHRSLWLACDKVNGEDYWADLPLERGQIRSENLALETVSAGRIVIANRCRWIHPAKASPFDDQRRFTISLIDERRWMIDCEFTLKAAVPVEIAKTNHSLFSIRVAPEIAPVYGGSLVNSEGGRRERGSYGKPARWCGFHGRRAGGIVEGITILDHPGNPWPHCPWFTRDYGFASPTPLNYIEEPFRLASGESLRLAYRVVLHAGDPQTAGIDRLYRDWTTADTP